MKKKIFLIIAMSVAVLFAGCSKQAASVVQNDGSINFIMGDVKLVSNGVTNPANMGDKVTQGMVLKTGTKAIAEITFQGSTIRINEKSSVVMTELSRSLNGNKEFTEFNVENGHVLFKVTRKLSQDEKFKVNTPTAVAGVRGTEFNVTVDKDKSIISCTEGKVAVKESTTDDSAFVLVEAGKEAVVEKNNAVQVRDIKDVTEDKDDNKKKKIEINAKDIKGPAMLGAEAMKGDIEGKK